MMNRNPSSIPQMQNPHKLVTAAQTMSFAPQLTRTTLGVPGLTPAMPPAPFPSFRPGIPVPPDFRGWYPSGQHSGSFPISGTPLLPVPVGMMSASPGIRYPPTSFQVLLPSPGIPVTKMPTARIQNRNSEEYVGPTTTVFVGNISERASDLLIRQMLTKCGNVVSWKRVQGASGKLQAFGFCEYREPGSSLRAIRLLHDFQLGDRKLLVKVDAKTKAQLDEWKAKRKNTSEPDKKEEEGKEKSDNEEELDDDSQKQDALVKASLDALVREYASELNALPSDLQPKRRRREKKEEDINNMEIEDEKKDLISREISKFRDTHMRSVGVT